MQKMLKNDEMSLNLKASDRAKVFFLCQFLFTIFLSAFDCEKEPLESLQTRLKILPTR